jgi:hypothetical protein
MSMKPLAMNRSLLGAAWLALSLAAAPAHARNNPSGEMSAASSLSLSVPLALSVAGPAALIVSGARFTVAAVEVLAEGTVWVLERASDGARFSVRLGREAAAGSAVIVGAVIVTTVVAAGCVLSAAGEAVAFIPNATGRALIHDERITR